jgi:predicted DNA-binding antitoxin AbrB/MazE fold protein
MSKLSFISDEDFRTHVETTIKKYGLVPYDLRKFNNNIVDPIKLVFDKTVFKNSWEEIVRNEIYRQRDKSNNNSIGYFHQRIFQYIDNCRVPNSGWDVIFKPKNGVKLPDGEIVKTIYVEMKNKHNTMNSASSAKTYIKMQGQLLSDDDCACFLVEAIASESQNKVWELSVDNKKQKHKHIRRVSMDVFYNIVTGVPDAFYQMCMILPSVIEDVVAKTPATVVPKDTVIEELLAIAEKEQNNFAFALYLLGFGTYAGFYKH